MKKFYHNRHVMGSTASTAFINGVAGFRVRSGSTTEVCVYDGVLDHVEQVVWHHKNRAGFAGIHNAEFIGRAFNSWEDIARAVRSPWPEGAERVASLVAALKESDLPQPRSIRRRVRFSEDAGDEVCLDRLDAGLPYWRTTRREGSIGPSVLTIAVQIGAPGFRQAESLFWRGAAAIALTELLEEAGYSVELWGYSYAQDVYVGSGNAFQAVKVKGGEDRIDVHALASATAGWYFRTVIFGGYYCTPNATVDPGLGCQATLHRELLPYVSTQPDKVMVVENCWSMSDAVEQARKYLAMIADGPAAVGGYVASA